MGAQEVYIQIEGSSMGDALKKAQDRARDEYGNDYYNGQINNCSLSKDITNAYNVLSTKKQKTMFINDQMERADKGEVYGLCIVQPKESKLKTKTKVERFPQKGARKWVTKYVVEDYHNDRIVGEWEDQTTAINKARAYTEKTQNQCTIEITKKLKNGNVRVANVRYVKGNSKQGTYIFIGSAPC